ncbi:MAG: DUF2779 domain-containing protein [Balneolaceae bacterium]|nr:DUF2779 domain-containing protein [Balneolaceae bacterium]
MTDKPQGGLLNDGWIGEAFRCPLRLPYAYQESQDSATPSFEPKRIQRAFLSELFLRSHGAHPQIESITAEQIHQGAKGGWMQQPIQSTLGYTRLPMLFRLDDEPWVIAQFQGRLWPMDQPVLRQAHLLKQKMKQYVVSLTYRVSCFQQAYPGIPVRAEFVFPSSGYFAKTDGLFDQAISSLGPEVVQATADQTTDDQTTDDHATDDYAVADIDSDVTALQQAFVRVSVDSAMNELQTSGRWFGQYLSSLGYRARTWGQWLEELAEELTSLHTGERITNSSTNRHATEKPYPFRPGRHCAQCRYRDIGGQKGCWADHQKGGDTSAGSLHRMHVFELPGHGNEALVQDGVLFVDQLESDPKADLPAAFTIPWRREEQIRQETQHPNAIEEALLPKTVQQLQELPRPFHFLDFEAVGFPIPQREGDRIYDPMLFQYSCHTWDGDASSDSVSLSHTSWLDEEGHSDPEAVLVDHLVSNPALQEGTIIHFSPFEPQHLRKIAKRWRKMGPPSGFEQVNDQLQRWMAKKGGRDFVDCLTLVREGYHHARMHGKLGLKPLIGSLLTSQEAIEPIKQLNEAQMGFPGEWLLEGAYEKSAVSDGETAMHTYLMIRMAQKSGLQEVVGASLMHPTESHAELVQQMKQYCALDTFAMYLAFHHWLRVGEITVY